jgi:saccharopine dehydrogenase (NAD+, L-lysine-forming)
LSLRKSQFFCGDGGNPFIMKIGIIRETKIPQDTRVPLSPIQCAVLKLKYPQWDIVVQPSAYRCYADEEYVQKGIPLQEDMSDCDYLFGIKEVGFEELVPNKKYFFFSHTIKKQLHNRKLLQKLLEKHVEMIDYETICDDRGSRLIAFGKWAGIVGAHNTIWAYGKRTKKFELPRLYQSKDFSSAAAAYHNLPLPAIKIVLTGTGRVANGAAYVLDKMGIKKVGSAAFLHEEFDCPVYVQLSSKEMYAPRDGSDFSTDTFHAHPELFYSIFEPYTKVSDIMINGIFWNKQAPKFFTKEVMQSAEFRIRTIGDITCDIAPDASIPSTLYATTIKEPIFGYNPFTMEEEAPFRQEVIDVMSIDNLPNELPRDASDEFGEQLIQFVFPEISQIKSSILDRATICKEGNLTPHYAYLKDFVNG